MICLSRNDNRGIVGLCVAEHDFQRNHRDVSFARSWRALDDGQFLSEYALQSGPLRSVEMVAQWPFGPRFQQVNLAIVQVSEGWPDINNGVLLDVFRGIDCGI